LVVSFNILQLIGLLMSGMVGVSCQNKGTGHVDCLQKGT
jgi:hypothetical protein